MDDMMSEVLLAYGSSTGNNSDYFENNGVYYLGNKEEVYNEFKNSKYGKILSWGDNEDLDENFSNYLKDEYSKNIIVINTDGDYNTIYIDNVTLYAISVDMFSNLLNDAACNKAEEIISNAEDSYFELSGAINYDEVHSNCEYTLSGNLDEVFDFLDDCSDLIDCTDYYEFKEYYIFIN